MTASVEPDLIEIGKRLRRLMSSFDDANYSMSGSFAKIDPAIEADAARLRVDLERLANSCANFLTRLESSTTFSTQRKRKEGT